MSILDTHIWIWWMMDDPRLTQDYRDFLQAESVNGLGVSAISCWEVAKLVSSNRIQLNRPINEWMAIALITPVQLIPLTPEISIESTQLPGQFHRDPADQMILATARILDVPLVTIDRLILAYSHVSLAP